MKKLIAIVISAIMVLTCLPFTAFAENGPSTAHESWGDRDYYYAFIYALVPDANGNYTGEAGQPISTVVEIFSDNTVKNDAISGVTYNRETNELTLDDGINGIALSINMMGDDFTIRVDGRVSLDQIMVWGFGYGGNLNIKGNGELTVNEAKKFPTAIAMNAEGTEAKVNFGSDVKVKLFAAEGNVIETYASTNSDKDSAFTFENGQSVEVLKEEYSYEQSITVNAIYLADPDEHRWGGYIVDRSGNTDVNTVYVTNIEYDDETDETLHTLGRYIYAPEYDAYVRDYDFGDRYENGYEYVFTEDEWNTQTEYTPMTVQSDEADWFHYYDPEYPEDNYSCAKIERASDPSGVYGFNEFSSEVDGEVVFEGYIISRFVTDSEGRFIADDTFDKVYLTSDELESSSEWSIVYASEPVSLEWTGTIVQGEFDEYIDDNSNIYVKDYEDNVYSLSDSGINIGDTFYYYLSPADGVNPDELITRFETVTEDGLYNYTIPLKELLYNTDATHTHISDEGTVTKKATPTSTGTRVYKCTVCGETLRTETIPKCAKYKNTLTAKAKAVSVKYATLKKKDVTVARKKAIAVTKAKGDVTYAKSKGNKKITVASNGKITVKKGLKKGTYKIKIKVKAAGNASYKALTKTVTVTITVK